MKKFTTFFSLIFPIFCCFKYTAHACTLCSSVKQISTITEDLLSLNIKLVIGGRLGGAKLEADGTGSTEFEPDHFFKVSGLLHSMRKIRLMKYIPGGEKNDSRTVIFCDYISGEILPIRAIRLTASSGYSVITKLLNNKDSDHATRLLASFDLLDHPEVEISNDAFMEWSKASDNAVGTLASNLDPKIIRKWLDASTTPANRLGLYSFMLGICGSPSIDSQWFESKLQSKIIRWRNALDGLFVGYCILKPDCGWPILVNILGNGQNKLQDRLAALRSIRALYGLHGLLFKTQLVNTLDAAIIQGDLADIAVEYLRQWQIPDLELKVLGLFRGNKQSPLLDRVVIHYALSWQKRQECILFVAEIRKNHSALLAEMEELIAGNNY